MERYNRGALPGRVANFSHWTGGWALETRTRLDEMSEFLAAAGVVDWPDIPGYLHPEVNAEHVSALDAAKRGVAFVTYDYGIDGVSIEISKYADCCEALLSDDDRSTPIHIIGGEFYEQSDTVIRPHWKRFQIEGVNGWSKWDGGKWFSKLFYEDMPDGSEVSREMAVEIWTQAVSIARRLAEYVSSEGIGLLVPVNINSNPGNPAYALGVVLVSEYLGIYVINSNHDFLWEGGRPATEHAPGEQAGVRDHFYRNVENTPFFDVFASLYPWNGDRWLQVNINRLQSAHLTDVDGFVPGRVSELSTAISEKFFEPFGRPEVLSVRRRMALILGDGNSVLATVALEEHLAGLGDWMQQQNPVLLGRRAGVELDPTAAGLIVLLQPTRIIGRKRIERDLHLLEALFGHETFREAFTTDNRTLQLHITGPVPIEHQADLETVLKAFGDVVNALPAALADRVFLSFSVGNEDHESFAAHGFERLTIEDIYRMADAVVFPSETEGRGLPIVEASACGVPIICSRYKPEQVFADVVGEDRPEQEQIRTIHFPEEAFSESFLDEISSLLLTPSVNEAVRAHNKAAVRNRYSRDRLQATFAALIDTF